MNIPTTASDAKLSTRTKLIQNSRFVKRFSCSNLTHFWKMASLGTESILSRT